MLEQPQFQDGESMKDAALALLAHVPPIQEVFLIGKHLSQSAAGLPDSVTYTCQILANPVADTPLDGWYDLFSLDLLQTVAIDMPAPVNGHAFPAATVTPYMFALFSLSYTAGKSVCTRACGSSLRAAQARQQPLLTFCSSLHCLYTGLHMVMLVRLVARLHRRCKGWVTTKSFWLVSMFQVNVLLLDIGK